MNHSSIQLNTEVGYRYQKVQDQRKSSALVLRLPLSHSLSPSNRKGEPHIVHHTLTHPQPTHPPTHTQAERPQSQITDGQPQTLDSRDSHCTTGIPTSYTPYLVTTGSICCATPSSDSGQFLYSWRHYCDKDTARLPCCRLQSKGRDDTHVHTYHPYTSSLPLW